MLILKRYTMSNNKATPEVKLKPIVQRTNLKFNGVSQTKGKELKGASDKILADLLKKGIIKYQ